MTAIKAAAIDLLQRVCCAQAHAGQCLDSRYSAGKRELGRLACSAISFHDRLL